MLEERSDSDNTIHPEFQLLYSIYKNLASMATERKDYRSAMESYLEVMTWRTRLIVLDPEIPFTVPEMKGISGTVGANYKVIK